MKNALETMTLAEVVEAAANVFPDMRKRMNRDRQVRCIKPGDTLITQKEKEYTALEDVYVDRIWPVFEDMNTRKDAVLKTPADEYGENTLKELDELIRIAYLINRFKTATAGKDPEHHVQLLDLREKVKNSPNLKGSWV